MNSNTWIIFALVASLCNAFRAIYIKKNITAKPILVVASTRLIAFIFLLILYPFLARGNIIKNEQILVFIIFLLITVILTFVATTLKIRIIQKEQISISSPLLSMTPIFIIPWAIIILDEGISILSLVGVVLAVFGAMIVLGLKFSEFRNVKITYIINILIIVMIYGLTTVIDKVEIGIVGGYLYSLIWTASSAMVGLYVLKKITIQEYVSNTFGGNNLLQSIFWALAFLFQQLAVQSSFNIDMNTAYIKSIMYLSIIINIFVGGKLFDEGNLFRKFLGAIVLIVGNVIIVFGG